MRDILFRGKRADNGEWIEGDSIQQLYSGTQIYLWCQGERVEVDSKTIGQYSGLRDKNGPTKWKQ